MVYGVWTSNLVILLNVTFLYAIICGQNNYLLKTIINLIKFATHNFKFYHNFEFLKIFIA